MAHLAEPLWRGPNVSVLNSAQACHRDRATGDSPENEMCFFWARNLDIIGGMWCILLRRSRYVFLSEPDDNFERKAGNCGADVCLWRYAVCLLHEVVLEQASGGGLSKVLTKIC